MTHTTTPTVPSDWHDFFVDRLNHIPLMAILRGATPEGAVTTARAAWDAGVELVEVTLERPAGVDALRAVIRDAGPRRPVGAGTLTTPHRIQAAREAGATFGVAPGFDRPSVQASVDYGLPFLPGVATASEVSAAAACGLTVVKAFPAATLGPGWVAAMAGPFPELRVVATGGVNSTNAVDFLTAGALALGVGGAIAEGSSLPDLVDTLRRHGP